MTMRALRTFSAVVVLLAGSAASAATLTLDYIAEVTDIDGSAAAVQFLSDAGVMLGADARGTVSLIDGVSDDVPGDASLGVYVGAVTGFTLRLAGVDSSFDGSFNDVYVSDDSADAILATGAVSYGQGGLGSGLAGLQLRDSTGSLLGSDALPFEDSVYSLLNFDGYVPLDPEGTALLLGLTIGNELVTVYAEIKVLDAKVVPLPAAVWMLGAALLSLAGLTRRR